MDVLSRQQPNSVELVGHVDSSTGTVTWGTQAVSAYLDTGGYNGRILLEVINADVGTGTLDLKGFFDRGLADAVGHAVGYQQIDGIVSPARAVAQIVIAANSSHVYQILDGYPLTKLVVGVTGSVKLVLRALLVGF